MGRFLTGASRIRQTHRRRVWMLLDNELFLDDNGEIYLAPRTMYTDNYTIPLWISWLGGSPVDFDVRPSHIHDVCCDCHHVIVVNLTEEELKKKGYLKFHDKAGMWVCENIPEEFLSKKLVGKKETNDIFNRCMKACDFPTYNRIIIRLGVCFNFMWFIDDWMGKVFDLDLSQIYKEAYWNEHVWY